MWYIKIKYRHNKVYKTLRSRSCLVNILLFLSSIPFGDWRNIEKLKIERLSNER